MKRILVIEDEAHVMSFIRKGLREEGFDVSVAMDGTTGLEMFRHNTFDLVVLDIMLPGLTGYEVCREMKSIGPSVPILFLTALGTPENIALGLNTGADDYLVKPFKFIEFTARINNLLRRGQNNQQSGAGAQQGSHIYRIGELELNDYTKSVGIGEEAVTLTATEYKLLLFFLKNKGRVLSRSEILDEVWDVGFDMGTNVVDVYVNYLRKKIDRPANTKLIHTVVGMGYVLKEGP